MDFTWEAAFSSQAMLGHLAYVVLIVSMLMRTLLWLRLLVIVAALLGIAYAGFILHDPVSTFWESLLVLVNIIQILRTHWRTLRARFTEIEESLRKRHFDGLSKGEARTLLDAGQWVKFPAGHVLSFEGQPVDYLHYIAEGEADVDVGGSVVSICEAGHFVGEMTIAQQAPATATVRISSATATLWRVESAVLRRIMVDDGTTARELDAAFARNYRDKLARMNRRSIGREPVI